jgi:photosystem II stability/assembly factor-like uncharacterized protein
MRRSPALAVTAALVAMVLVGDPASAVRPQAKPAPFHAQAMSWISPDRGWMLGWARCGHAACTTVVGTADGGQRWRKLGTLAAPLTLEEPTGVTELAFADDLHGWAFEPDLWATSDGGASWQRQAVPGGGHLVLALAGDADGVYALVSPCRLNRLCTKPATLWRTKPGRASWRQVSLALPSVTGLNLADIAVHGSVAYLMIPTPGSADPDVLAVTLDGRSWNARPDPCVEGDDEYLSGVAPISDTAVAMLCVSDPGFGYAVRRVVRSSDTGHTTQPAGTTPLLGIVSRLAAAPDGTLLVSSYSIGSWIYRDDGGETWTTPVDEGDGGMGWNDIVFTTNQVGFVVHGPAASPWLPGELWRTDDGGLTWSLSRVALS